MIRGDLLGRCEARAQMTIALALGGVEGLEHLELLRRRNSRTAVSITISMLPSCAR